jgi:NAD/NADP transhydrogenase beta subunit
MSLKTSFTLISIFAGIFALVFLLIPEIILSMYGSSDTMSPILMTRFFGSALLVIALITFFLKDAEYTKEVKSVVLALLIGEIVGFFVALWGQLTNLVNSYGWFTVILYGFFTIVLYLVYKKK